MTTNPPTILIVDDDWMNRELLQAYLEIYQVLTANSGERALSLVGEHSVDLVMLDLRLPGISGYEVCARLKSNPATQPITVLVVSGMENDETRQKILDAGADDFLFKPFDAIVLMTRVRNLLRIKSLSDELQRREQALWNVLISRLPDETARQIVEEVSKPDA